MRTLVIALLIGSACGSVPPPVEPLPDAGPDAGQMGVDAGQPDSGSSDAGVDGGLYFPPPGDGWETAASGWDPARLEEAALFAQQQHSTALIVLDRGRIVLERYWPLANGTATDMHTAGPIFSAGKSVVSALLGEAIFNGQIELERPVSDYLDAGWSGASPAQEQAIVMRHLVTMTSGLRPTPALSYAAAPGTQWVYNTDAYYKVIESLEAVNGKARSELLKTVIGDRIGLEHSQFLGNFVNFSARDMARFGLLMLAHGSWAGTAVLHNQPYLDASTHSSQTLNPSYGYLWWLNGQSSFVLPGGTQSAGPLIPAAPADLFAALGAGDKKIYVCPREGWVVVRHGPPADTDAQALSSFDNQLWTKLMAAAPAR